VANNPNSQALAEGAVGIARMCKAYDSCVLRRMYKAYDSSDWPTMLPEANAIMNNRKNAATAAYFLMIQPYSVNRSDSSALD
jgi:hypothetical protein